jgi:sugar phosphate permease
MSILKGIVGFLTFLLAFDLRRAHATIWYGPTLSLSIAGAVVGVLLVPRARRLFTEQQVLALAIWLVALTAVVTAVVGGVVIQTLLAFVIGLAGGAGKPAFDALVQRHVPTAAQGRAFARFETRLQLIWVLGALLPVVATTALTAGDIVIAAVAGVGGLSYMTGRRAVRYLRVGTRPDPTPP